MSTVKTIAICLPEDLIRDLKVTADKLGISVSALIRIKLLSAPSGEV